ncbi:MAG: hypothetical protein K9L30_03790 [Desulfobacterales bacterium]|nr:hypothetical protein [Desulfobacterales bacterium]
MDNISGFGQNDDAAKQDEDEIIDLTSEESTATDEDDEIIDLFVESDDEIIEPGTISEPFSTEDENLVDLVSAVGDAPEDDVFDMGTLTEDISDDDDGSPDLISAVEETPEEVPPDMGTFAEEVSADEEELVDLVSAVEETPETGTDAAPDFGDLEVKDIRAEDLVDLNSAVEEANESVEDSFGMGDIDEDVSDEAESSFDTEEVATTAFGAVAEDVIEDEEEIDLGAVKDDATELQSEDIGIDDETAEIDDGTDGDSFADSLGVDIEKGLETPVVPVEITTEQLEAAVENVIEKMFSEKMEKLLEEVIERTVTREIDRLKQVIMDDAD